jgi:HPt (histidine-containing phosphotransfer) domain-containing protein
LADCGNFSSNGGQNYVKGPKHFVNHFRGWVRLEASLPDRRVACNARACAMIPDLQRMDWMPSPPLAPLDSPLDLDHLARMTLGDADLEREVLAMFSEQSVRLVAAMAALPADAAALAHKLKGSARGIGAFAVAEAAAHLECAIRTGDKPAYAFAELKEAVAEVRTAIDELLSRS